MTRSDRLTRDDYQAAMASLDWQDRRRIELSSRRGVTFEDPSHAAMAAERAQQSIHTLYWGLVTGPIATMLLWLGITGDGAVSLTAGVIVALAFAFVVARLVIHHRARARHLVTADFETAREIAQIHRFTYRRRD